MSTDLSIQQHGWQWPFVGHSGPMAYGYTQAPGQWLDSRGPMGRSERSPHKGWRIRKVMGGGRQPAIAVGTRGKGWQRNDSPQFSAACPSLLLLPLVLLTDPPPVSLPPPTATPPAPTAPHQTTPAAGGMARRGGSPLPGIALVALVALALGPRVGAS